MNKLNQIQVDYLSPSRTIEKIELSSGHRKMACFVYNYEGYSFRFFENIEALDSFFRNREEPNYIFENETELDIFLEDFPLPL